MDHGNTSGPFQRGEGNTARTRMPLVSRYGSTLGAGVGCYGRALGPPDREVAFQASPWPDAQAGVGVDRHGRATNAFAIVGWPPSANQACARNETTMCRMISQTALAILLPLYGDDRERGDSPSARRRP